MGVLRCGLHWEGTILRLLRAHGYLLWQQESRGDFSVRSGNLWLNSAHIIVQRIQTRADMICLLSPLKARLAPDPQWPPSSQGPKDWRPSFALRERQSPCIYCIMMCVSPLPDLVLPVLLLASKVTRAFLNSKAWLLTSLNSVCHLIKKLLYTY